MSGHRHQPEGDPDRQDAEGERGGGALLREFVVGEKVRSAVVLARRAVPAAGLELRQTRPGRRSSRSRRLSRTMIGKGTSRKKMPTKDAAASATMTRLFSGLPADAEHRLRRRWRAPPP